MRHDGDRRQRRPGGGHRAAGRSPVTLRSTDGDPPTGAASASPARSTPMPGRSSCSPTFRDRGAVSRWSSPCGAPSTSRCRSSTTRGRSRWPRHASARRPARRRRRASSSGPASAAASSSTAGCTSVLTAGPASWPTRSSCATARPCGCGNRGCLEAVASSRALAALAGQPTIEDVFRAAAAGDQRAAEAIETVADHLGVAIANVITMLVPGARGDRWRRRRRRDGSARTDPARRRPPLRARARLTGTRSSPPRSARTPARSAPHCGLSLRNQRLRSELEAPPPAAPSLPAIDRPSRIDRRAGCLRRSLRPSHSRRPRSRLRSEMNHVDDVAVGDVAGLGALERAAVLIEEEPQLDQQRRSGRDVERRRFGPPGGARRDRARCRRGDDAERGPAPRAANRRPGQRPARRGTRASTAASSKAIGTPSASRTRSTRTTSASASNPSASISSGRAGVSPAARTRELATFPRHSISSLNDRNTPARRCIGRLATNVPLPAVAIDEPGVGQLLQRLAHRHPADPEPGAQLRLARQRVT